MWLRESLPVLIVLCLFTKLMSPWTLGTSMKCWFAILNPGKPENETQRRSSLHCFLLMSHIKIFACALKRQNMLQMWGPPAEAILLQNVGHCIYTGVEDHCGELQQDWTLLKAPTYSECKIEAKAYKLLDILCRLTIILFMLAVIRPHRKTSAHKQNLL